MGGERGRGWLSSLGRVGHLYSILAQGMNIWTSKFSKVQISPEFRITRRMNVYMGTSSAFISHARSTIAKLMDYTLTVLSKKGPDRFCTLKSCFWQRPDFASKVNFCSVRWHDFHKTPLHVKTRIWCIKHYTHLSLKLSKSRKSRFLITADRCYMSNPFFN